MFYTTSQYRAVLRVLIVEEARKWLGTPFALHQRVRGTHGGVDCVGLIEEVGAALGLLARDARRDYSLWRTDLAAQLDARMDRVPTDEPHQSGDVLAFTVGGAAHAQHLAIATDAGILHTYELVGRVVEHGLSHGWRSRLAGVWRFRGAV